MVLKDNKRQDSYNFIDERKEKTYHSQRPAETKALV